MNWGTGSATQDVSICRVAAGVLGLYAGNCTASGINSLAVYGGNSGTGNGSSVKIMNGSTTVGSIGNWSAVQGGAYNADMTISSNTNIQLYANSGDVILNSSSHNIKLGYLANLIPANSGSGAGNIGSSSGAFNNGYFTNVYIGTGIIALPSTLSGNTGAPTGKVSLVPGTEAFGNATLSSGTYTVSNAAACTPSATCVYKLTNCGLNGSTGIGTLSVGTVSAGTSFVINSLGPTAAVLTTDKSIVCWQIN
jgi:hypothetical protein